MFGPLKKILGGGGRRRRREAPAPNTYVEAQQRYQQLTYDRALMGTIEGKKETRRAGVIDNTINAIKSIFPDLSLTKDYTVPAEAEDAERPATLAEIQALANSIPIPSLGAQGSAPPMLTTEGAAGFDNKALLGLALGGLVLIGVLFFFLRK